jgi:uncharacterized protein YecE (DUF72 family)
MTELLVGTCGWSYPDWVGPFYPPGTASEDMLARYAEVFDTVEVNSSFYAVPPRERTRRWDRITPEDFDFAVKAPRDLTHEARLDLDEADDVVSDFVTALRPLGLKVGIVLLQLPPSLTAEEGRPRLERILEEEAIPAPIAVEARHESWNHPSTYSMLEGHDTTWVWSDNDRWSSPSARTSSAAYLRFIGDREIETFDELQRDPEPQIQQRWADLEMQTDAIEQIRVYANNHFAGFGPGAANAFLRVAGQEPREWGAGEQGGQSQLGEF